MYTKQALYDLGMSGTEMTQAQREQFDRDGFYVIEGVYSRAECKEMADEFDRLIAIEGNRGGHEVHVEPGAPRVSNIYNKTAIYDRCLECKPLLAASHYLLGEFKLHGANLRDPLKGEGHQELHCDVPKKFQGDWWVSNAIFTFDDMTLDNGPTRVVPGSHHWAPMNVAYVNIGDWVPKPLSPEDKARVPKDANAPYPGEVFVTAPAGSVIIINSCIWHSGTRNKSGARRRVLHLTYTRRDLPQQLTQRDFLTDGLYQRMSPAQRFLMDIEPLPAEAVVLRQPKLVGKTWWN